MKKVLIDTNIYSAAMKGEKYAIDILKRNIEILLSPVVVGELLLIPTIKTNPWVSICISGTLLFSPISLKLKSKSKPGFIYQDIK